MSDGFPCPNPTCSHIFPAAAVAGAAVLTCPRCATVFQFHAGAAAVASGVTPAPAPRTVVGPQSPQPKVPLAVPVTPAAPPPAPVDFGAAEVLDLASIRRRAKRHRPQIWKTVVIAAAVLAGLAFALFVATRWERLVPEKRPTKRTGQDMVFEGSNFRFQTPGQGWWLDDKTRDKLRYARLVLHRQSPASWFAVLVKDFKVRNPRPREMYHEGLYLLEQFFTEHLEHEYHDSALFQGRPAQLIDFRGQLHKQTYRGECHLFSHQGYGYWILTWSLGEALKQLEPDITDLRRRFALGDERKTWEEKRPALRDFVAKKAGIQLRDTEGLWEEALQPASDFDKDAVLVLHAREQDLGAEGDSKRNVRIASTVMVLLLPASGGSVKNAVDQARAHLLARQKMDYPETTLEPFSDKDRPPSELTAVGNARGHLGFVRVRNGETRHLLVVQAVIPRPDHTLVLQGECHWKQRAFWEDSLLQLVHSLQVSGGP